MLEEKNSQIHLRPRFKIDFDEPQEDLIQKFRSNLDDGECKYCSKIVDGHIVIDVPREEDHFWSPQLQIEIEKVQENESVVKGLFGPKPTVWTLFMFIHFLLGTAFIGFSIMAYVQYLLKKDATFAYTMLIAIPVIWVLMYIFGRIGRRAGHQQMEELHDFMKKTLAKR